MPEIASTSLFSAASLVAYYKLENVNDSDSGAVHLTNNNTVTFIAGNFNNCASFNGSNQSLSVNNSLGIDGGSMSISAWINPTTVTSALDHLSYASLYGDTTKTSYGLTLGTTGIRASRLRASVAWDDGAQFAITASVWTHAVLTYDGTNLRLYLNGVLQDTFACSGSGSGSATSKTTLGCRSDQDSLTGQINTSLDDVGFFNVALTQAQITEIFKGGSNFFLMF